MKSLTFEYLESRQLLAAVNSQSSYHSEATVVETHHGDLSDDICLMADLSFLPLVGLMAYTINNGQVKSTILGGILLVMMNEISKRCELSGYGV